jgi:hypothetical protein
MSMSVMCERSGGMAGRFSAVCWVGKREREKKNDGLIGIGLLGFAQSVGFAEDLGLG